MNDQSQLYQISNSQYIADQFRALIAIATSRGKERIAIQAARWMIEELQRTPLEFGESRSTLEAANIQTRISFVQPLYVIFGVHEPSRTVFIGKIAWSERR